MRAMSWSLCPQPRLLAVTVPVSQALSEENHGEETLQSCAPLEGLLKLGPKDLTEVMELLKLPSVCAGSELLAVPRNRLFSLRDLPCN